MFLVDGRLLPQVCQSESCGIAQGREGLSLSRAAAGGLFISLLFWANAGLLWEVPGLQKTGASDLGNLERKIS